MPTESEVVDQLSDYCQWLEADLAAPMHRARVVKTMQRSSLPRSGAAEIVALSTSGAPPYRRSRLGPTMAAAVLAVGAAALVYRVQHEDRPVTVPAPSVDTTDPGSLVPPESVRIFSDTWAPLDLPNGLVVWDVGWARNSGTYGAPFTEQLFGRYDPTDTTVGSGLLVRIQDSIDDVLPADSNARVAVRGAQGWVFNPDPSSAEISIKWVELGRQISVQGRGMTLDEAVVALDALQWRADGAASFDQVSSPLPLIAEEASGSDFITDETTFSITDPDGPTHE